MILRRTVLLIVLLFTGLVLETSLFGGFTLTGTKPELLLLVALALAITEGPGVGATAGFVFGLGTDVVLQLPQGIGALTFTLAAYGVGRIRGHVQSPSAWMPIVLISLTTFVAVLFYGGFSQLLGEQSLPGIRIVRHAGLAAAYNALLTPFLFPLVRGLAATTRPRSTEVMP